MLALLRREDRPVHAALQFTRTHANVLHWPALLDWLAQLLPPLDIGALPYV